MAALGFWKGKNAGVLSDLITWASGEWKMLLLGQVTESLDTIVSVTHCKGSVALDNESAAQVGNE